MKMGPAEAPSDFDAWRALVLRIQTERDAIAARGWRLFLAGMAWGVMFGVLFAGVVEVVR